MERYLLLKDNLDSLTFARPKMSRTQSTLTSKVFRYCQDLEINELQAFKIKIILVEQQLHTAIHLYSMPIQDERHKLALALKYRLFKKCK